MINGFFMDKILEQYSDYLLKEKRFSLKTFRAYIDDVTAFLRFVSLERTVDLSEIDYSYIRAWIIDLSEREYSSLSINRKVSSLKSFFKFLYQKNLIQQYPLVGHKSLRVEKKLQVPFSEKEVNLVLVSFEGDDYEVVVKKCIVFLFYFLGIRKTELIELKLQNVDFYSNTIKVVGKRNKERVIPIVEELRLVLCEFIKKRNAIFGNSNELLILSKKGNKLNETFVYRLINSYFRGVTSKSKKSPHMLRHTFATHMLNNGADLNSIKELLGHSSLSSTQIYTQTSLVELKKVYKNTHPRFKDEEF